MNNLSEKIGFYYLIFQRTLNDNYLKCWMDGEEDWNLYTKDQILSFCNSNGLDYEMTQKLKFAFDDTSFWLWDVDGRSIRRLSSLYETPTKNIFDAIKEKKKIINNEFIEYDGDDLIIKL